jgi:hypothetical protein
MQTATAAQAAKTTDLTAALAQLDTAERMLHARDETDQAAVLDFIALGRAVHDIGTRMSVKNPGKTTLKRAANFIVIAGRELLKARIADEQRKLRAQAAREELAKRQQAAQSGVVGTIQPESCAQCGSPVGEIAIVQGAGVVCGLCAA